MSLLSEILAKVNTGQVVSFRAHKDPTKLVIESTTPGEASEQSVTELRRVCDIETVDQTQTLYIEGRPQIEEIDGEWCPVTVPVFAKDPASGALLLDDEGSAIVATRTIETNVRKEETTETETVISDDVVKSIAQLKTTKSGDIGAALAAL